MTKCLRLRPLKLRRQLKLTEAQTRNRLAFVRERKKICTIQDWRRVLFSDESVSELMHPPKRQKKNERVWAHSSAEVPVIETVKLPLKVMAWAMMSHRVLSDLHIFPRGQTVTAEYYVEDVLRKTATLAMNRKRQKGPPTGQTSLKGVWGYLSARRRSSSSRREHSTVVQDQAPGVLGEGRVAGQQP